MKKSLATSIALIGILAAASGPAFASSINDLIPRATLQKFCSDKANNSRNAVQFTFNDGAVIKGTIKCEAEYFNSDSSDSDYNDGDYDDKDDDYDNDDDDYDNDDDDDDDYDNDDDDDDDD